MLASAPIVRFAFSGGPAASRNAAIRRAVLARGPFRPDAGTSGGGNSSCSGRGRCRRRRPCAGAASVGSPAAEQGVGRPQHEQLLRQHLLQLPRRDAEAVGGDPHFVEVVAGECAAAKPCARNQALSGTPHQRRGGCGATSPPPPRTRSLEGRQGLPRTEARGQADDGDRRRRRLLLGWRTRCALRPAATPRSAGGR